MKREGGPEDREREKGNAEKAKKSGSGVGAAKTGSVNRGESQSPERTERTARMDCIGLGPELCGVESRVQKVKVCVLIGLAFIPYSWISLSQASRRECREKRP